MESELTIDKDGDKYWYNCHGQYHRENDLPAVVLTSGYEAWYINGYRHRENGPAIIYSDGSKEWWLNDERFHKVKDFPLNLYFTFVKYNYDELTRGNFECYF